MLPTVLLKPANLIPMSRILKIPQFSACFRAVYENPDSRTLTKDYCVRWELCSSLQKA